MDYYDGNHCLRCIYFLTGRPTSRINGYTAFALGNIVKYLWRAGRKDGSSRTSDAEKALFYAREVDLRAHGRLRHKLDPLEVLNTVIREIDQWRKDYDLPAYDWTSVRDTIAIVNLQPTEHLGVTKRSSRASPR